MRFVRNSRSEVGLRRSTGEKVLRRSLRKKQDSPSWRIIASLQADFSEILSAQCGLPPEVTPCFVKILTKIKLLLPAPESIPVCGDPGLKRLPLSRNSEGML